MSAEPAPASPGPSPETPALPNKESAAVLRSGGFWLRRRLVPLPTWRLWLCLLLGLGTAAFLLGRSAHQWLSVTEPIADAGYLAVEGWAPDHVINATSVLAEDSGASRVFCTGIPLEVGSYLSEYRTYADVAANSLAKLGLDPRMICPVPCADVKTERTRAMASALKAVLDGEPVPATGRKINIVTLGTHARRSRAIFRDVLGPEWQVGIISIPATDYDPSLWYRQSAGAKSVITELSALSLMAVGGN